MRLIAPAGAGFSVTRSCKIRIDYQYKLSNSWTSHASAVRRPQFCDELQNLLERLPVRVGPDRRRGQLTQSGQTSHGQFLERRARRNLERARRQYIFSFWKFMTKGNSEAPLANSAGTEIRGTSPTAPCLLCWPMGIWAAKVRASICWCPESCHGARRTPANGISILHLTSATMVAHSLNCPVGSDLFHRGMRMMIVNVMSLSKN